MRAASVGVDGGGEYEIIPDDAAVGECAGSFGFLSGGTTSNTVGSAGPAMEQLRSSQGIRPLALFIIGQKPGDLLEH